VPKSGARETLYGEFIRECSKLVVDSFTHTFDKRNSCCPCMSFSIAFGFAPPTACSERGRRDLRMDSPNNTPRLISRSKEIRRLIHNGARSTQVRSARHAAWSSSRSHRHVSFGRDKSPNKTRARRAEPLNFDRGLRPPIAATVARLSCA
jgi:hypothetical protein